MVVRLPVDISAEYLPANGTFTVGVYVRRQPTEYAVLESDALVQTGAAK